MSDRFDDRVASTLTTASLVFKMARQIKLLASLTSLPPLTQHSHPHPEIFPGGVEYSENSAWSQTTSLVRTGTTTERPCGTILRKQGSGKIVIYEES